MKKQILNLGKQLSRNEQKALTGGFGLIHADCRVAGSPCFRYFIGGSQQGVCNRNHQCVF